MQDTLFSVQSETRLDGRRIVEVMRRRPYLIAAVTILAPLAAFVYLSRQTPVYKAECSIIIDSATPQYLGSGFRDVVDVENNWWTAQEYLSTQFRIIQSRGTAISTAQALCKRKLPDGTTVSQYLTGDASCSKEVQERVGAVVLGGLDVQPVKESRVVILSFKHANQHVAAEITNAIAETYERKNLEQRLKETATAATWLGRESTNLDEELRNADNALVRFKEKNNILSVSLDDQANELAARRRKIVDELSGLQIKLIALGAQREQYSSLRDNDPLRDTSPQLQENPVIQHMKEIYAGEYQKMAALRGRYGDKMPQVIEEQARLDTIKNDIQNEARLTLKSLDGAYAATQKQEKDLEVALEKTTREGLELERHATEYNRLKRDFERLQKLSEQVGGRDKESSLAAKLNTNNVSILDPALVPQSAIKPSPLLVGAISMVVGFLLGFSLAFLFDLLDATIKTQEDIEERLRIPFLGVIPRIQPSEKDAAILKGPLELYIHGKPKSPAAECCRAIRTSLMFMSPDKPLRRILITSGEPQEGKSTSAVSLAITLAQSNQRVLLVDTDMRRPRVHKIFKLPTTTGFSSVVAGEAKIDDAVRETEVRNLFVIPCGPIPPNPAELLHSERCKQVVRELGEKFDRVIFDSPPLGIVTDAAILSQLCDGAVLVAKTGKTSRELLFRSRKQLVDIKATILGCVLNDLDLLNRAGYGYRYYHYRYGQYYASNEEQSPPQTSGASGG